MNCTRFQKQLPEFVEGTLSAAARAEAGHHLAHCDACRQALGREQRFAQVLSDSLRQKTEKLTLRLDIRQNILMAARRKPAPPTLRESIIGLLNRYAWQTAISMSVLLAVSSLLLVHLFRPRTSATETAHSLYPAVSIQIASRVPAWEFRSEGNQVVDALSYETVVASGTIAPGGPKPDQR